MKWFACVFGRTAPCLVFLRRILTPPVFLAQDSSPSSGQQEDAEEEYEEDEESDSEGIPPLDLDSLAGPEPIPSSVLKGRQLVSVTGTER